MHTERIIEILKRTIKIFFDVTDSFFHFEAKNSREEEKERNAALSFQLYFCGALLKIDNY